MAVGDEGLLCALVERLFADASEVPTSNKATATTIRADLVMLLLQALPTIELLVFQIIIKQDPARRMRTSGGPLIHALGPRALAATSSITAAGSSRHATRTVNQRIAVCVSMPTNLLKYSTGPKSAA